MRGRPKSYENQAEKQKAYRERKKAPLPALRKSPAEIWQEKVDALHEEYERNQQAAPRTEAEYPAWLKEHLRIYNAWVEAHHRAYYLRCYESGFWMGADVRAKMVPEVERWIEELAHANGL